MRYQAYDKYQPSRLEWIDVIPESWDITRLRLLSNRYSGGTPSKDNSAYWQEGTIPWLNSGAVNQGTITKPSTYITELGLKESSAKWVPEKAIIIALAGQGKTKGTAAYTTFKTTCNQSMGVVVFEKDFPRFMYWWLVSQYKNIRGMASDDARDGLNLEMLGTIPCPLPSIPEQQKIAAFLDYKTQQIDQLIEKKKALIERLEEKRIAVITQAVTKGLDKNAKLKPSGVDWLGYIPEHWEVRRLRFLLAESLTNGLFKKAEFWGRGKPIVNVFDVYVHGDVVDESSLDRAECDDEEYEKYAALDGDFFFVRSSLKLEGVGKSATVISPKEEIVFECHLVRGRPDQSAINSRFLNLYLNSKYAREYFVSVANVVTMATIDQMKLKNLTLVIPDLDEQTKIVAYVEKKVAEIDAMHIKTTLTIEKLNEYRSSLITSAVTGKVDVRDVDIPKDGE